MPKNDLKSKRSAFCCYYAALGDPVEAAVKAGFSSENALTEAARCLELPAYRKKINSIRELFSDSGCVAAGLRRLAFGSCTDAVYLVFADELPPQNVIEKLDLFNVSELKRVKGGGVEVKFFDRLKALEKLFELENSTGSKDKAEGLIRALMTSGEEDVLEDQKTLG